MSLNSDPKVRLVLKQNISQWKDVWKLHLRQYYCLPLFIAFRTLVLFQEFEISQPGDFPHYIMKTTATPVSHR